MSRSEPQDHHTFWTGEALDALDGIISGSRHAENNPEWVERKYQECVKEGRRRLKRFPDLRIRYTAHGYKCNAMTLRTLPIQVFFRAVEAGVIAIFDCQWASQDATGPQELGDV